MLGEFLSMAAANLWRMKLRTALTAGGIVIGVGALAAMLSFSFGMQKNVMAEFRSLNLFRTLHVMPSGGDDAGLAFGDGEPEGGHKGREGRRGRAREETSRADRDRAQADRAGAPAERGGAQADSLVMIDDRALEGIAAIDHVDLVYPQDTFDARVEWGEEHAAVTAQALPADFGGKRGPRRVLAGRFFAADSSAEAVVSTRLLERLGTTADSILGDTLHVRTAGRAVLIQQFLGPMLDRMQVPEEMQALALSLVGSFTRSFGRDRCDVVVVGVIEPEGGWGFRLHDVLLPAHVVAGLDRLGFSNPIELLSRMQSGDAPGYPLAVVTVERESDVPAVRDAVEALGLRTFSFVDQFEEMRRAFLIFDLVWAVIGVIALAVASLGIANTMIMSVLERVREIGVLKSLGAREGHVRGLFLVESGLIGLGGSLGGVLLGWLVSRLASLIVRRIMVNQGAPPMDLFHLPGGIALAAIAFGVGVSLLSGLLPAARAARIDPVRALRRD